MNVETKTADVVIAGGGTGGVVAALAAARTGAKTVLVEGKGYTGGIAVEGGTALHSFYNLWKAFPGVEKRQVVKGIPQEIIDRLITIGGANGHLEMETGYDYDSVCTAIDVELYKLVTMQMLEEAGVTLCLNTLVTGAETDDGYTTAVQIQSRSGVEQIPAKVVVDCTGYGDLAAYAGAQFTEPNDYPVANSIGVGGVSVEGYFDFLEQHGATRQVARGPRDGKESQLIRIDANRGALPDAYRNVANEIGMAQVISTVHNNYFMFLKLNYKMDCSPTDPIAVSAAELELRRRQKRAIELLRKFVPGCQNAFIARSSPSLCIRRGRCIVCDYDIPLEDVLHGKRFADEIAIYGFHDSAPRLQIADGGVYGIPYRALLPQGLKNLLVAGMMITSDHDAHMSTRNTVACMIQGQAAGTAAAMAAASGTTARDLNTDRLRKQLRSDGVCLDY